MSEAVKLRRLWRIAAGLAGGLLSAAVVLGWLGVSQDEFLSKVREVRPPLLFAAAGSLLLLMLQSLRWWIVVRRVLPLSYWQATGAMMVGFFGNALVPARGGDLLRIQYVGKRHGTSRAKLLGTTVVDFWSDKWGWITAFAVICLVGESPRWMYQALLAMGALVLALAAALALMASRMWPFDASRGPRGPKWMVDLRDGFASSQWKWLFLVETVIAPLPWLWESALILVAAYATGLSLTLVQAFSVLTAFNLATVVMAPGNAGSFEAGGTLALVSLGAAPSEALAFSVLYHLAIVLPTAIGGGAILVANGDGLSVLWRRQTKEVALDAPLAVPEK
jgi:uncharacterized membrane protein YbhN (UPF0104 family)